MKPIFTKAIENKQKVIFSDGENEKVLRATQVIINDGIAEPILIGRPGVIESKVHRFGLNLKIGEDFIVINPESDPRFKEYSDYCFECVGRSGLNPQAAKTLVRTNNTIIGAISVAKGDSDALICGLEGRFADNLTMVNHILGKEKGVTDHSTLSMLISNKGIYFFTDAHVTVDPSAKELAETTLMATRHLKRFGIEPKIALLSHSNFGTRNNNSSLKMREALNILKNKASNLMIDGEMHGDSALSQIARDHVMPNSPLKGEANLLVFPNLDAANISLNLIREMTDSLHVGPILLGSSLPAHILTSSVSSRGIVNMTALAAVEAIYKKQKKLKA